MLLVTLSLTTLLSVSQNGISPITLNKQLRNHLNKDIINASSKLACLSMINNGNFCNMLLAIISTCLGIATVEQYILHSSIEGATTFSTTTFSIMALSIMTLSIKGSAQMTFSTNDTPQKGSLC
jgi:hypothetical protein